VRCSDDHDRNRAFAKNVREGIKTVAKVAIVGGVVLGAAALEALADDDAEIDWSDRSKSDHNDRHKHHSEK